METKDEFITIRIPKEYHDKLRELSFVRRDYKSAVARAFIMDSIDRIIPTLKAEDRGIEI